MPYVPPYWSFAPFVLILLAIAILPLVPRVEHWWHHNRNKLFVALALALATLAFYLVVHPGKTEEARTLVGSELVLHVLDHAILHEYVPFIVLLFSLYTISGGILLTGDIEARPRTNCAFLAVGSLLASFIGTTGASMLLIRPLLKTNAERRHKVHTVIFFILLVSNIGGSLTPLGDPPLFLGFLKGVGFWWPLIHLLLPWAVTVAVLLVVYFVWDSLAYRKEEPRDIALDVIRIEPLRLRGAGNFIWLLAVIVCVATVDSTRELPLVGWKPLPFTREVLLLLLSIVSWVLTPGNREIRERNGFNFFAITEVACLFLGIFVCMQPAIEFLHLRGAHLGMSEPAHFFWVTGAFSSFLDNAPTYVVFFETAKALTADSPSVFASLVSVHGGEIAQSLLFSISLGSVFMGANTYIGNAPNFMVKSIAEHSGVKMPSFFGYILITGAILMPIFAALTLVFME